jgi:Uma2 family endonuclease
MVTQLQSPDKQNIIYPDSDGEPIADNTEQFTLIVWIKENLELLFANNPNIFVARELLWYPVQGSPEIRRDPDVMVAFDRPKGYRGSYLQWQENNIAPQVVFEILSPGNSIKEMTQKFAFYRRYGVEEYYLYDPDRLDLCGWLRAESELEVIDSMDNWVSPRLGIKLKLSDSGLQIYRPDNEPFLSFLELDQLRQQAQQQAQEAQQRAQEAEQRAQQAETRSRLLEARLREMGIDPNQV